MRLTALLAILPLAACGDHPTSPTPPATFLSYVSGPGELLGQGVSHRYVYGDGVWGATASTYPADNPTKLNRMRVTFDAKDGTGWTVDLLAPAGQVLSVGSYANATRFPFQAPTEAGLTVVVASRACNKLTGRFTITELSYRLNHVVSRLHFTFEEYCDGEPTPLSGEILLDLL